MSQRASQKLHVAIATPLGRGGHGGIDRLMWQVADEISVLDPSVRLHMLVTRGQGHIALSTYWMVRTLATLVYLRAKGEIDVLHVNLSKKGSTYRKIALCAFATKFGLPYIIHLHSGAYRDYWSRAGRALSRQIGRMFANASRIIVLGSVWRDFVIRQDPALCSRVVVLPNATPVPPKARISERGPVRILFLGQLGKNKGVPQLVAALGKLSGLPNWRATLAGDGSIALTRQALALLSLSDRVEVCGWIGATAVADLLARSDILVLPSFNENLPMSVIEGMAAGLAVVATPVGAVEDIIIPEKTGLLVPPGDVEALAEAIRRLITDEALRERLGREAKNFHQTHLELSSYVKQLCQQWREVAGADWKDTGDKL